MEGYSQEDIKNLKSGLKNIAMWLGYLKMPQMPASTTKANIQNIVKTINLNCLRNFGTVEPEFATNANYVADYLSNLGTSFDLTVGIKLIPVVNQLKEALDKKYPSIGGKRRTRRHRSRRTPRKRSRHSRSRHSRRR